MSISLVCSCGAQLSAPDAAAGKTVACPKCKAHLKVPSPKPVRAENVAVRAFKPNGIPPVRRHRDPERYDDQGELPSRSGRPRRDDEESARARRQKGSALPWILAAGGTVLGLASIIVAVIVATRKPAEQVAVAPPRNIQGGIPLAQGSNTTPAKSEGSSKPRGKGKPVATSSDFDFCRVGQLVTIEGKVTVNLSKQINVNADVPLPPGLVGGISQLGARTNSYAKDVGLKDGDFVAVTGTIVEKSTLMAGQFGHLLLDDCTFQTLAAANPAPRSVPNPAPSQSAQRAGQGQVGELNVSRMEVGQRGYLPEGRVGQAITKGLYLMHFRDKEGHTISVLVSYPKKELADEAILKIPEEVVVIGTYAYTTKTNDSRTAYLVETTEAVERANEASAKAREAKAKEEAEAKKAKARQEEQDAARRAKEAARSAAYEKALQALTPFEKQFIGKWRIADADNKTRCFFAVFADNKATMMSKSDVQGTWESTTDELRITWDDGSTDALRPMPGSKSLRVLSRKAGADWKDMATSRWNAIKQKGEAPRNADEVMQSRFVGRWKLVNDKGEASSYLTVTDSGAKRDHAPDSPGTWEVVGNEARFTWEDGFRDIMRLEHGKITFLILGKATSWDSKPNFRLLAVRIDQ
jgi:hypothetical protein